MIRYVKGVYSMNVNGGIVVEIQSGLGLEIFFAGEFTYLQIRRRRDHKGVHLYDSKRG